MVTELIRAVNYFTGNCQKPIILEILATGATLVVYSMTVIGFMRYAVADPEMVQGVP